MRETLIADEAECDVSVEEDPFAGVKRSGMEDKRADSLLEFEVERRGTTGGTLGVE
jgi:hypothetical protein